MASINIKGVMLGEGAPKTIISVMEAGEAECLQTIEKGKAAGVECFEWRGDFNDCRNDIQAMVNGKRHFRRCSRTSFTVYIS